MSVTIGTNVAALGAIRNLNEASEAFGDSASRLASGNRIQKAGDDPAGLARSAFLEVDVRDQRQIVNNALDARSMLQVTESGLNEVNNLLMRMRELSVAGASDIAGPEEREALQVEANSIRDEIERISQTTTWGKNFLLNGSSSDINFQVGIGKEEWNRIAYPGSEINVQAGTLGVDSLDFSDPDSCFDALNNIDEAIFKVQSARATTGAFQSRLNTVVSQAQKVGDIAAQDLSRVKDTDYAKESAELVKREIQQQAAISVLAQANMMPANALRLLGPITG